MNIIKEFFGIGGYQRPAEGYMSPQHLIFVSSLIVIMTLCAVFIGRSYKGRDSKEKNKVLMIAAIMIDSLEIFKIIFVSIQNKDPLSFVHVLPLFLCSIQLITIPLAAFSRGRIKEASIDFVTVFGLLGAIMGTYFAGNNYACYPVISFDNVVSGVTHCIAGFSSLYIMISGMAQMKKRNIPITVAILSAFCIAAYIANIFTDCNYMFLTRGDGTPYDIIYNMVCGNPVLYPILVFLLFIIYILGYYFIYSAIVKKAKKS